MKHYTGRRAPTGCIVTVHQDGQEPRPLNPRLDLRNHSPTGFEWSYSGSGPAQLALALAADALGDDERAQDVYQHLKSKLVARLPSDAWTLSETQIQAAASQVEQSRRGRGG
jgi:hypothetical protein